MDSLRLSKAIRSIRIRRRWRQVDLALAAGVTRDTVSRVERGRLREVSVADLAAVCGGLDASLDVSVRWHGGDLDRLMNARHAALHEAFARLVKRHPAWTYLPEVSFNVFGERGVIDVVLWHAVRATLLVVELKTEIVDVNELVGSVDRKRRLGPAAVRSRGWRPLSVAAWVVVADSRTNRRRIAEHETMLRAAFPAGRQAAVRTLGERQAASSAIWLLTYAQGAGIKQPLAATKRVRKRGVSANECRSSTISTTAGRDQPPRDPVTRVRRA